MIIQTTKKINGVVYDYAYSDSGFMIERDGVRYSEAVDPLDSGRLYTETDEPINVGTKEETVEDYKAALQIVGVETEENVRGKISCNRRRKYGRALTT